MEESPRGGAGGGAGGSAEGGVHSRSTRLLLVDLAGSESTAEAHSGKAPPPLSRRPSNPILVYLLDSW